MNKYPSVTEFINAMEFKGFKIFKEQSKSLNLNIVGWRSKYTRVNQFDDILAVYWRSGGFWESRAWPITTYPGIHYLRNPLSSKGTSILVPGQYLSSYSLGVFKGYTALKQVKPVKVYRDKNKDSAFDQSIATIEEGLFGLHIHKAGVFSQWVGNASAGCQVFQKSEDFKDFIKLCEQAALMWGNLFTYTLMEI